MNLKPFWRYFGGKYRSALMYPQPKYDTIIEPFAGAAGYSLRYNQRKIVLVEKYPIIAGIWKYLIKVSEEEILLIPETENIENLPSWVPQEARWLVGFNLNDGASSPRKVLSVGRKKLAKMGRKFEGWNEAKKNRIASQLHGIRHWRVIEGDFTKSPDFKATWFIDPPYQVAGKGYVYTINDRYEELSRWCLSRKGQIIVCESSGANWLPFDEIGKVKSFKTKKHNEAIFIREG